MRGISVPKLPLRAVLSFLKTRHFAHCSCLTEASNVTSSYGRSSLYPPGFLPEAPRLPWKSFCSELSGTKLALQNRSDHGGRKRACNHSFAESQCYSPRRAQKSQSLAISEGYPQNRRKLAATTATSRRNRSISWPRRPQDTKVSVCQSCEQTLSKLRTI